MNTMLRLNRDAVTASVAIVNQMTLADLLSPTPCASWLGRDLIEHMTIQHIGFAAAARGEDSNLRDWRPKRSSDSVGDYSRAASGVIKAFSDASLAQQFVLPEIVPGSTLGAKTAIGFHFIDYLIHGWDVAKTVGLPFAPSEEAAQAALAIALELPNGPERLKPGAAFAPGTDAGNDKSAFERVLGMLGRDPNWTAS